MYFPDDWSVARARSEYFQQTGLSEPSGARRWEWIKLGPVPFPIFNTASRVRALRLHDLHHIATGFGTDLRGEAEQSAWELAAGCRRNWFAWSINVVGVGIGLVIAPLRTWRGFKRGRACDTLYASTDVEAVEALTVGQLRARLFARSRG